MALSVVSSNWQGFYLPKERKDFTLAGKHPSTIFCKHVDLF
jgi:hypothetical protein